MAGLPELEPSPEGACGRGLGRGGGRRGAGQGAAQREGQQGGAGLRESPRHQCRRPGALPSSLGVWPRACDASVWPPTRCCGSGAERGCGAGSSQRTPTPPGMWPLGVLVMGSLQQEEAHSSGPQSSASPQLLGSALHIVTQGNMRKSTRA